ncbi:hypothetical protein SUGI_0723880 [Cryptomeria japonica]|nr:hypothetical protein SUGI_0723880 [Cryptomeria japonica]
MTTLNHSVLSTSNTLQWKTRFLQTEPAMNNIQKALSNANLQNDIKVSTPHATSVLYNSFPPSKGTFGENMSAILKFLSDKYPPFLASVYPYFSYKYNRD